MSARFDLRTLPPFESARFWKFVERSAGCWLWKGFRAHGYGWFRVGGKPGQSIGAHRVAWALTNGAIPEDKWVLHTCNTKACVRPSHLYLGSRSDNAHDAWRDGCMWSNGDRTHCKRGHEFTSENTYKYTYANGWRFRMCRACRRLRDARVI